MKISKKTRTFLEGIITGNSELSPYKRGAELIEFFEDFGENDIYGNSFLSRHIYVREKLNKFNGTEMLARIIAASFDFHESDSYNPEVAVEQFNPIIARDGYQLVKQYARTWMEGEKCRRAAPYFEVRSISSGIVETNELAHVSHEAVKEQIQKAREKSDRDDHAGDIASCYTLVEHLLKLLLDEEKTTYKDTEGDIRTLYKQLKEPLNLDAGGKGIHRTLRPILNGLQQTVSGLYDIANNASDRHARKFNPAKHHAQLAVNTTFTLAEFLVATRDFQKRRRKTQR